ncbi:hypothetical protein E4U39_006785 [Claviceps sp. Clav50 group G5]|nr:hypothetical protein E4U39_006785 [Claviceps sp. Clav50 group G5]
MESKFDDAKLLRYTDSELYDHISSHPSLPEFSNVVSLSPKYLAKGYENGDMVEDALSAMKFASQLGIQVPHIERIVHGHGVYCIMERIPGTRLDIAWHDLGWIASLRLAFQLRRVVQRMRSATSTSSGPIPTGKCTSYFFDDKFGLPDRAKCHHVNAFLNFWANFPGFLKEKRKTPAEHANCPRLVFSYSRPFVFTHHDLAPRNMIIDSEGQLRIIDWDEAGFYPEFFEYAGMHNFIPRGWTQPALWRWKMLVWIAGGLYDKECRWLKRIRYMFTHFRMARAFNLRADGYAAFSKRPFKERPSTDGQMQPQTKEESSAGNLAVNGSLSTLANSSHGVARLPLQSEAHAGSSVDDEGLVS